MAERGLDGEIGRVSRVANEDMLRQLVEQQNEIHRRQRAAMEEVATELRQAILASGVDRHLLREYRLAVIDLSYMGALERTSAQRFKNLADQSGSA